LKRLGICTLAVILAACGGPTTASGGHPNVSPTPKPSLSPSSTTGSVGGRSCRLPVVTWTQTAQGRVAAEGFLTYPTAQLTSDASGGVVLDGTRYRSTAKPYLYGGGPGAGSYDWPLGRWLPVKPRSVSPDGSHYAYSTDFGAIHVVDVATGIDRTLKGLEGPDYVLYYAKEGVYFNQEWEGPPGPGLWLLDPVTGTVQAVVDPVFRQMMRELHTDTHILNALVFRSFNGALVTGVQMNEDGTARMDFDVPEADNDKLRALEGPINDMIRQNLEVRDDYVPVDDAYDQPGLIRSKSVAPPPTLDGKIRIVEIVGLDRQACGGTHLGATGTSRAIRILKIENKGRHNRRMRIGLAGSPP